MKNIYQIFLLILGSTGIIIISILLFVFDKPLKIPLECLNNSRCIIDDFGYIEYPSVLYLIPACTILGIILYFINYKKNKKMIKNEIKNKN